mmetsp:Transcript_7414/g.16955  ORF Transcript_7414/g.16955 Transcript_7414/m.16955 type:complete len:545 (-) Transcript_7414:59-1693(-)
MAPLSTFADKVNDCFAGVSPADFECKLMVVTPVHVAAPAGFEESWVVFDGQTDEEVLNNHWWLAPGVLARFGAVVIFVDLHDEPQVTAMKGLVEFMNNSLEDDEDQPDGDLPPILCMSINPDVEDGQRLNEAAEMQLQEDVTGELLMSGVRYMISCQPQGFDFMISVQGAMTELQYSAEILEPTISQRVRENHYRSFLKASIHDTLWEFLRHKVTTSIPPMLPNVNLEDGHIAGYRLGKELGRGRTSIVYEATPPADRITEGLQVMKVIEKATVKDLPDLKRINRGLEVMELLKDERWRHPNITQLYGVFHTYNHVIIRMEHCGVINLYQRLAERDKGEPDGRPLSTMLLHSIAKQMIVPVAHIHGGPRICHRDLKPGNYIVHQPSEETIHVKLADFDLAMVQRPDRMPCSKCGTFPFMAPEVLIECEYDGCQADVWGAGMVLLEVMCRRRLLEAAQLAIDFPQGTAVPDCGATARLEELFSTPRTIQDLFEKFGRSESTPMQPEIRDLIIKMIQPDMGRRITSQQACDVIVRMEPKMNVPPKP